MDDAMRTRLANRWPDDADVTALLDAYDALLQNASDLHQHCEHLLTAQAQAAPVLAAAEAWGAPDADLKETYERLRNAVTTWRAAREG